MYLALRRQLALNKYFTGKFKSMKRISISQLNCHKTCLTKCIDFYAVSLRCRLNYILLLTYTLMYIQGL